MKNKLFVIYFIIAGMVISAQTQTGNDLMESGLTNFSNGNYTAALSDLREIILDPGYKSLQGTAYYWIARTYMAQNLLDKAENNLDFFIKNYPDNKLFPDAVYQKGRILYRQGKFDSAIQIFYQFIESYGDSPFVSNSYFWIAESLYYLGHLEKAETIYSMLIREYPNSYKIEAAKYKKSLISLKYRENELLKLLKISHEEYLKALEDFQRREKIYEQSINNYQRKLLAATSDDSKALLEDLTDEISVKDNTIESLNEKITKLNDTIDSLKIQINNLSSVSESAPASTAVLQSTKDIRLLNVKNSALKLKEFYINWLSMRIGE